MYKKVFEEIQLSIRAYISYTTRIVLNCLTDELLKFEETKTSIKSLLFIKELNWNRFKKDMFDKKSKSNLGKF